MDDSEQIRRDFARAWSTMGAAWGVTPSTAAVQGYLLLHGGPLTKSEIQTALGLSHRATLLALADCRSWGLIEPAPEPRRAGQRGPTTTAWVPVADHWEWFRRVAEARKRRETDPVLPLLDECLRRARVADGADDLRRRIGSLLGFVHQFDRAGDAVVRSDARALAHLFGVLDRVDDETMSRLLAALAAIPADELASAARSVARMPPALLRRLIAVAARPGVERILRAWRGG